MRRVVLCLVILSIAGGATARSQRPRDGDQRQSQPRPTQQSPNANPQPTPQPPITVNVLPTPKTEAERAEEAHERQGKVGPRQAARKIYRRTLLRDARIGCCDHLFSLSRPLGLPSSVSFNRADIEGIRPRAEDQAADAAEISARAALRVELPVLIMNPPNLWSGGEKMHSGSPNYLDIIPFEECFIGVVSFANRGRTVAMPLQLDIGFAVARLCPPTPVYSKTGSRKTP